MTRSIFWRLALALGVVALMASFLLGGLAAFQGLLLGLSATWLVLFALWQMIKMLGRSFAPSGSARSGTFLILLIFFMKLPLYVWLAGVARGLKEPGPTCFLVGVGLVYCLLVGWASLEK